MAITPAPGWVRDPNNPNGVIRDLNIQSGDSAAILGASRNASQNVAGSVPTGTQSPPFGAAIIELLKKYQTLGTKNFQQQQYNAQQQQNDRVSQETPASMIGASPSLQSSTRSAYASALSPTIQGAQSGAKTFSEQIQGVGQGIDSARALLADYQSQQDKERDDARNLVNQALTTFGSKGFDVIDPKYIKLAGYDPKTIELAKSTLKERELEAKLLRQTTPTAPKLTGPQVDALSAFETTIQSANKALGLLSQGAQSGPISGRALQVKKLFDAQNPNQLNLEQLLAKIKADFMKAISGAAVSESEAIRLAKFLPDIYDQEGVMQSKLQNLITETQRTRSNLQNTLNRGGGTESSTARERIIDAGYNYDAIKRENPSVSDEQILADLGL